MGPRFGRAWGRPVSLSLSPKSEGVWRARADAQEVNAPVQRATGFSRFRVPRCPDQGQPLVAGGVYPGSARGCSCEPHPRVPAPSHLHDASRRRPSMDGTRVTYGECHLTSRDDMRCEHFFRILQIGQSVTSIFRAHFVVMAGLVPAIHVFAARKQDVDARDERGHDVERSWPRPRAQLLARMSAAICGVICRETSPGFRFARSGLRSTHTTKILLANL